MGFLNKIVHNDAIKQDPKEIYGWRVYALACSVRTNNTRYIRTAG